MNLACKATLAAITDIECIDDTVKGYKDYQPSRLHKDVIATLRSFITAVKFYSNIYLVTHKSIDLQQQFEKTTIL